MGFQPSDPMNCRYSYWYQSTERHGCDNLLSVLDGNVFYFGNRFREDLIIRSYSNGIKVGCTFLTTEALEKLYKWHSEFLKHKTEKTHQI